MIHSGKIFLIALVTICLLILTGCETTKVIVYPVIITPDLPPVPTHEPWHFTAIDENNQLISNVDAKNLGLYIMDLKEYGETLRKWLDYYIEETSQIDDKLTQ
jgi:hypothetical protein